MSPGPVGGPKRRWWLLLSLIFAGQVGSIFWLGDKGTVVVRKPAAAPLLRLAGNDASELLQLEDPTLFARPRWDAFSGPAWLNVPTNEPPSADLAESPRWLALSSAEMGAEFEHFFNTNKVESANSLPKPQPELTMPPPVPLVFADEHSSCRLEGELARRPLLTAMNPPPVENTDILTNSVVRLVVDADGRTLSVALLSSSGLAAADTKALALAREARFEPLYGSGPETRSGLLPQLSWGEMIFEWAVRPPSHR